MGNASHTRGWSASCLLGSIGGLLGTSDGSGVTCGFQLLMSISTSTQHYQRACCCLLYLFIHVLAHISHTGRHSVLNGLFGLCDDGKTFLCMTVSRYVCIFIWKWSYEVCDCAWACVTHLALLVYRFYGERVGSDVNNRAQLEPICGVRRPHWPPILHDSLLVGTTTQLVEGGREGRTETQTQWRQQKKNTQSENRNPNYALQLCI